MSEDKSLESLGINIPKPLEIITVNSGRKFMRLGSTQLYLALNYEIQALANVLFSTVTLRIMQKVSGQDDEVILEGDNVTWDAANKAFRNPKSVYVVFSHPASHTEVLKALKEDEYFLKLSNILNSVYDIQIPASLLESGLVSLDAYLSIPENIRPPKQAIKL